MSGQLFTRPSRIKRHQHSRYAAERHRYLCNLIEEDRSKATLQGIAPLLVLIARHLPLDRRKIRSEEITK